MIKIYKGVENKIYSFNDNITLDEVKEIFLDIWIVITFILTYMNSKNKTKGHKK